MTTTIVRGVDRDRTFDVLVIGGGITGAAIAYEAASTGLSTALVEKADFGGATSAATGKLIHGGLRYLKNFELGLVRESLAERRVLSAIAPNLVVPFPMVLPEPGLVEHLGLTAYDLLAFDRNRGVDDGHRIPAHRMMDADELERHGLGHIDKAILYFDCMMPHPERLTLAFIRSAVARGAQVENHTRVDRLLVDEGRVTGAEVVDEVSGASSHLRARMVVNATGPWAHDLLSRGADTAPFAGPRPPSRSEGIYLVTRKLSDIMVLYVSDRGHFSFAPWRGYSLIGPTETPYRGDVDDWALTGAAIDAFLEHINTTSQLPVPLTRDDVMAAYGGLRPLVEASGDDSYGASRASEVVDHAAQGLPGLVSATGGKYTTSRAFAEKVRRHLDRALGRGAPSSPTAAAPLNGCEVGPREEAIAALRSAHERVAPHTLEHLWDLYGADASAVLALADVSPRLGEVVSDEGAVLAQALFAARHEAALHLDDVLVRRTALGTRGPLAPSLLHQVATVVGQELGWDEVRRAEEVGRAERALRLPA